MRSPNRFKIVIIFILLIVFFGVLNLTSANKAIKNFFYSVSSPAQKWLWKAGMDFSGFFGVLSRFNNLEKENEDLRSKIQELINANASLRNLEIENEALRGALSLGMEKEFMLNQAEVVGKDISQDYLIIGKGAKDAMRVGFPVVTPQKALVGKISEVYQNFSKVILISNKKLSFDAQIQERDIYGMVKGSERGKILLELIPREKEVRVGDPVITSALGGNFPKGLLVGEIQKVIKSDVAPFQTAEIKPAFENNSAVLFVITNFESLVK